MERQTNLPPSARNRYGVVFSISLLLAVLPLPSQAQECVFTSADAIPDTLDASSYYPLAVGNIWENEFYRSDQLVALQRREVVGYAFFKDVFYFRIDSRDYDIDASLDVTFSGLETDYQYVTDSSIVRNGGFNPIRLDLRFNSDIRSCYQGIVNAVDSTLITVDSIASPILFLEENGQPKIYDVKTIKRFSWTDSTMEFGFGFGLIATSGADSLTSRLVSAIIDGTEYGTSLSERYSLPVAIDEAFKDISSDIDIFPMPAKDEIVVSLPDLMLGATLISIFDVTGRHVLAVERVMGEYAEVRLSVTNIRSGIYFLTLRNGNTIRSRQFIVIH